jgi:hypothetical protein
MAEVIHRYVRRGEPIPEPTEEQKNRRASDAKFAEARARKETALAELRESELRRRKGELIEKNVAVMQASFLFGAIRQKMLALPTLLVRKLQVPDAHQARMIIDADIRELLTELSKLPEVITQRQFEDFIEAENAENGEKTGNARPKRKSRR